MKKLLCFIMISIFLLLVYGCGANTISNSPTGATYSNTVSPSPLVISSVLPIMHTYVPTQTYSSTPKPMQTPVATMDPNPFPKNGKTQGFVQSSKYPDFAYYNSALPTKLYTYPFNRFLSDTENNLPVNPVDFYNQSLSQDRKLLLEFYKSAIFAFYNVDYINISKWESGVKTMCNSGTPTKYDLCLINGKNPVDYISDTKNELVADVRKSEVTNILTNDSMIYLNKNAHYCVRGRVVLKVNSSNTFANGVNNLDVEVSFKQTLFKGFNGWAQKEYVVTNIHVLP